MITRQRTLAARTNCFHGRRALFRPHLMTAASAASFNDSVVCEYSPAPVMAAPPPVGSEVLVTQAPPALVAEVMPRAPGYGLVWIPGAWVWEDRWAWAGGHWARPPHRGAVWVRPRYEERHGAQVFVRGGWR